MEASLIRVRYAIRAPLDKRMFPVGVLRCRTLFQFGVCGIATAGSSSLAHTASSAAWTLGRSGR